MDGHHYCCYQKPKSESPAYDTAEIELDRHTNIMSVFTGGTKTLTTNVSGESFLYKGERAWCQFKVKTKDKVSGVLTYNLKFWVTTETDTTAKNFAMTPIDWNNPDYAVCEFSVLLENGNKFWIEYDAADPTDTGDARLVPAQSRYIIDVLTIYV